MNTQPPAKPTFILFGESIDTESIPTAPRHDDKDLLASLPSLDPFMFPVEVLVPDFISASWDPRDQEGLEELTDALIPLDDPFSFMLIRHTDGSPKLFIIRDV